MTSIDAGRRGPATGRTAIRLALLDDHEVLWTVSPPGSRRTPPDFDLVLSASTWLQLVTAIAS